MTLLLSASCFVKTANEKEAKNTCMKIEKTRNGTKFVGKPYSPTEDLGRSAELPVNSQVCRLTGTKYDVKATDARVLWLNTQEGCTQTPFLPVFIVCSTVLARIFLPYLSAIPPSLLTHELETRTRAVILPR